VYDDEEETGPKRPRGREVLVAEAGIDENGKEHE